MILVLLLGVVLIVLGVRRNRRPPNALPENVGGYDDDPVVDWRTAAALARFEGVRLLRHPAFLVGIALTGLTLWAATWSESSMWRAQLGIALGVVPLGWCTIIAANLATLRSRRYGSVELLRSAPAAPSSLTAAHIGSAIATVPVTVGVVGLSLVVVRNLLDAVGPFDLLELAVPVLVVAGGGIVGVAVGRYLPSAPFGIVAVVAVIQLQIIAEDAGIPDAMGEGPRPWRHLAFLVPSLSVGDPGLELRRPAWHAAYLLGATVALVGVALARHGRTRTVAGVVAIGVVLTAGSAWVETRPPSPATTASMVGRLIEPERHQRCTAHGNADYCAYPPFSDVIDEWRGTVERVLAQAPAASLAGRRLRVEQRAPTRIGNADCAQARFHSQLHPEVADRVDPDDAWRRDGELHPGFSWPETGPCGGPSVDGLFLGVQAGAWAVGLPPAPWGDNERCRADGEARAVIALWLGAHAGPGAAKALAEINDDEGALDGDRLSFPRRRDGAPSWDAPPMWGVEWRRADVKAALRLLEQPAEHVGALLAARWTELTAPGASASLLLSGVSPPGEPAVSSCA